MNKKEQQQAHFEMVIEQARLALRTKLERERKEKLQEDEKRFPNLHAR